MYVQDLHDVSYVHYIYIYIYLYTIIYIHAPIWGMVENDQPPKATGSPKAAARSRADGQISAGSDPDAGGEVGVVQPGAW